MPGNTNGGGRAPLPEHIFIFVLWERARNAEPRIREDLQGRFRVLRDVEVAWPRSAFVGLLAEFYDERNWWKWFKKAWRCGRGPMRLFVVEDERPVFALRTPNSSRPENRNVVDCKERYRGWVSRKWAVHASTESVETDRQLRLLTGMSVAELCSR